MKKILCAIITLSLIFLTACASVYENIIDDRHRHTNIYLPGKVAGLTLSREQRFDREGKNMGYYYRNYDEKNFVLISVYVYPIPVQFSGDDTIDKQLEHLYPNSEKHSIVLNQSNYKAGGKYIKETDKRSFANYPNQIVQDSVYLFTFGDEWFVKYMGSYQKHNESTAEPIVKQFIEDWKWTEPSNFKGREI